jgi:hypothetical protein
MTKREIIAALRSLKVPMDATIGFRANDLGPDSPAEPFRCLIKVDNDDFAKTEQNISFIFI